MRIGNAGSLKTLLFSNLSTRQTVFKNTFWLALADVGSRTLRLFLFLYVARVLGATEYGKFTFALASVLLFQVFADFGLSQIITREFAKDTAREKDLPSLLSLKVLLSAGVLLLIAGFSFFVTNDPFIRTIIWILAIGNVISDYLTVFYAFFQSRQKMEYESTLRVFESLILVAAGFFVLLHFPSVAHLSYAYVFSSFAALVVMIVFFRLTDHSITFSFDTAIWKKYLAMSWPLALIGFSYMIYNEIDSVMMGYFGQLSQTGWYNAAYRIIATVTLPAGIIAAAFFPVLSSSLQETKEKIQRIWNYQMESMIFLALPLVVGGVALAPNIIRFVFDASFEPAILAFQMLLLMAGVIFLYTPFHRILIVVGQQKKLFWATLAGAVGNIIFNAALIPHYSLYGAAFSTIVTHVLIFFVLVRFVIAYTDIRPLNAQLFRTFLGAACCSAIMYFVVVFPPVYALNVLLTIFIGAGTYVLCFAGYRYATGKIVHVSS